MVSEWRNSTTLISILACWDHSYTPCPGWLFLFPKTRGQKPININQQVCTQINGGSLAPSVSINWPPRSLMAPKCLESSSSTDNVWVKEWKTSLDSSSLNLNKCRLEWKQLADSYSLLLGGIKITLWLLPLLGKACVHYNVLTVAKIMKTTPVSFILYKADLTTLPLDLYFSTKGKAFIQWITAKKRFPPGNLKLD